MGRRLRMLSLFSGIGGIDLAAQWARIETVAFCEIDPFCQKVLKKHWPDVPIFGDIKTLTKEVLDDAGITGIDIVAGGDPCQPYSNSGERQGEKDDRFYWPEMFSVISTVRPPWVVRENVVGNLSLGIDKVLSDLENIGYRTQTFIIPAIATNAEHERERIFTMAHAESFRRERWRCNEPEKAIMEFERRCSKHRRQRTAEPRPFGVAYGLRNRMDRCRVIGNSVSPQQIYPIFAAIAAIEEMQEALT